MDKRELELATMNPGDWKYLLVFASCTIGPTVAIAGMGMIGKVIEFINAVIDIARMMT